MKTVTDATFKADVLDSDIPVLVDFWAEWCGPCKVMVPTLEAMEPEYAGKVAFAKVNVDEQPGAPTTYGIRSLPTLILFKGGQAVGQLVGGKPRTAIAAWLDGLAG